MKNTKSPKSTLSNPPEPPTLGPASTMVEIFKKLQNCRENFCYIFNIVRGAGLKPPSETEIPHGLDKQLQLINNELEELVHNLGNLVEYLNS